MAGPTEATVKSLFAVSGNQCAFPGCGRPLVIMSSEAPVVTGRICHIKGRKKGAKRYDTTQSERDRHDFRNLILLCGDHHTLIDADDQAFTVSALMSMKAAHEAHRTHHVDLVSEAIPRLLIAASSGVDTAFHEEYECHERAIGLQRSEVIKTMLHPDAVQSFRNVSLHARRVKAIGGDYHCLVISQLQGNTRMIGTAFKIWPSLGLSGSRPIELLRTLAVRFGLPIGIGDRSKPPPMTTECCLTDRDMGPVERDPVFWFSRPEGELSPTDLLHFGVTDIVGGRMRCRLAFNIDMKKYLSWLHLASG